MAHGAFAHDHGDGIAHPHLVLYVEDEPQHHHDDGTFHQDHGDESVRLGYAEGQANTSGVVPEHMTSALRLAAQVFFFAHAAGARFSSLGRSSTTFATHRLTRPGLRASPGAEGVPYMSGSVCLLRFQRSPPSEAK
jgi:hypothetical protein